MTTYSNPRTEAVIENWPSGNKRVTARFWIERNEKTGQERGMRETTGATKKLTYAQQARIVDGDDGRTYIVELTAYGHISIMRGDMKYQAEPAVFSDDPRYPALRALFS